VSADAYTAVMISAISLDLLYGGRGWITQPFRSSGWGRVPRRLRLPMHPASKAAERSAGFGSKSPGQAGETLTSCAAQCGWPGRIRAPAILALPRGRRIDARARV